MRIDLLNPLSQECRQLLLEIESLPASDLATKCSVMCSALLEKISNLPAKPKVSPNEIHDMVGTALCETDRGPDFYKNFAIRILTCVGIELEPDKEEWEREFEKFDWDASTPLITKQQFKAVWQACEKSKEK